MPQAGKTIAQSGVLPYRKSRGIFQFLLVTSLGTGRWIIPKGHIEPKMSARQSAEKEAFEEAGVAGRVSPDRIGYYSYQKDGSTTPKTYLVEVFGMQVLDVLENWPEAHKRQREWMTPEVAADSVDETELRDLILGFWSRLSK